MVLGQIAGGDWVECDVLGETAHPDGVQQASSSHRLDPTPLLRWRPDGLPSFSERLLGLRGLPGVE